MVVQRATSAAGSEELQAIGRYIQEVAGISLDEQRLDAVRFRLLEVGQAHGYDGLKCLRVALSKNQGSEELRCQLIEAVTTHTTSFWRERHHFSALEAHVRMVLQTSPPRSPIEYRVWCAACSTGEEAYSLALTLARLQSVEPRLTFKVLATDISRVALEQARRGRYCKQKVKQSITQEDARWFDLVSADEVEVIPQLKSKISFVRFNLNNTPYLLRENVSAIFCRNILIYFDQPDRRRIKRALVEVLKPKGLVAFGHSDRVDPKILNLRVLGPTVYCKKDINE